MRVQLQDTRDHTNSVVVSNSARSGVTVRQVRDAMKQLYDTRRSAAQWFPSAMDGWFRSSIVLLSIKLGQYIPGGTTSQGTIEQRLGTYHGVQYRIDIENLRGHNLRH